MSWSIKTIEKPSEMDLQRAIQVLQGDDVWSSSSLMEHSLVIIGEAASLLVEGKSRPEVLASLCDRGLSADLAEPLLKKALEIGRRDTVPAESVHAESRWNRIIGSGRSRIGIVLVVLGVIAAYWLFAPKSLERMGCEDSEVQVLAKKLLVVAFDKLSKPQSVAARMMDSRLRGTEVGTIMNSIAALSARPERVSFSSIESLVTPRTPVDQRPDLFQDPKILYVCSAQARIRLPSENGARFNKMPVVENILKRQGNTIEVGIIYATERGPDDKMVVRFAFQHPMMGLLLGTTLQIAPDALPEP
jgi:hypothetical protein